MTQTPYLSFVKYLFLSLFCFAVDQLTKYLIKIKFSESFGSGFFSTSDGQYQLPIIEPFLMIKRISNKGIAWGIDGDGTYSFILTPITIALTILIIVALYKSSKLNNFLLCFPLALILGGAFGNLYDRIVFGEVVDFIALFQNIFPFIFNLADTFITIGMFILIFAPIDDIYNTKT